MDGATQPLDRFRAHDAAAGRAIVGGTAVVEPAGTVTAHVITLIGDGKMTVAASVTDRLEVGATAGYVLWEGPYMYPGAHLKVQVYRDGGSAIAIQGGAMIDGGAWAKSHPRRGGYVAALGSACLNDTCKTLVSGHALAGVLEHRGGETESIAAIGLSVITGGRWRAVVDATAVGVDHDGGLVLYGGARVAGRHLALDFGLAATLAVDSGAGPIVALSARI